LIIFSPLYADDLHVANRPSALISKDHGNTWQQLPWSFETPSQAQITPFWNITEDEGLGIIIFSEYGGASATTGTKTGPHHRIMMSPDSNRTVWIPTDINWGVYRHIHGYHINPYKTKIHFLFLGDPNGSTDGTPGFYVSQDGGATWSGEVLNQSNNVYNFGGDQKFRNGPCMVTWWPSGKAFIANDSAFRGVAAWYGNGPTNWGYIGLKPQINMLADVDKYSTWPATPWDAKAVENGYETYCASNHDGAAWNGDPNFPNLFVPPNGRIEFCPPSVLWRFDPVPYPPDHDYDGMNGRKSIIAKIFWPGGAFIYISAGRNNTFPDNADFIFCNAWGGIRIPRKNIKNKPSFGVSNTDLNTNTSTG
jgi:hypothetical protein